MAKGTHGGGRYGGGGGVSAGDIISERDMVSMVAEGSKKKPEKKPTKKTTKTKK